MYALLNPLRSSDGPQSSVDEVFREWTGAVQEAVQPTRAVVLENVCRVTAGWERDR
jgi:hypothetical protein